MKFYPMRSIVGMASYSIAAALAINDTEAVIVMMFVCVGLILLGFSRG